MKNGFIGEGLKSDGVNLNVLNILRSLLEDEESLVYIPQNYKRGSASSGYDSKVHMVPAEAGKPIQIIGLNSNQERFNFSVLGLADVMVEKETDDPDGQVELVPKKVFRQYNIVRDSKLMMEYVVAKLSHDSFIALRDAGILYYNGIAVASNHKHNPDFIYKIRLSDLPIVSCNWARPVVLGLYDYLKTDADVTAQLKNVNAVMKQYKEEGQELPAKDGDQIYNESIDSKGSDKEPESYDAPCVTYEIDGYKSVPQTIEFIRECHPDIKNLESYRKSLKDLQSKARFNSRCIIMAIENSKKKGSYDWSELEDVPRSKTKKRQYCTVTLEDDMSTIRLCRTEYIKTVKVD